jgi:hypothetical protein
MPLIEQIQHCAVEGILVSQSARHIQIQITPVLMAAVGVGYSGARLGALVGPRAERFSSVSRSW